MCNCYVHVVLLYHILFILYMFACNVMYCTHTTSNRYTPRFLRKKKLVFIKNNLQALKLKCEMKDYYFFFPVILRLKYIFMILGGRTGTQHLQRLDLSKQPFRSGTPPRLCHLHTKYLSRLHVAKPIILSVQRSLLMPGYIISG